MKLDSTTMTASFILHSEHIANALNVASTGEARSAEFEFLTFKCS